MNWSLSHQVMSAVVPVLCLLTSVLAFRRGQPRQGQLFAYIGLGFGLMGLDRLFPHIPPWLGSAGALLAILGPIIYFSRVHSVIDWRRYPKPGEEPDPG